MLNLARRSIALMAMGVAVVLNYPIAVDAKPPRSVFAEPIEISGAIAEGTGDESAVSCKTIGVWVWEYIEFPDRAGMKATDRLRKRQIVTTKPKYRASDATCQYRVAFTPTKNIPPTAKRYIEIAAISNVKPPTTAIPPHQVCSYRNHLRLQEGNPIPVTLDFSLQLTCTAKSAGI